MESSSKRHTEALGSGEHFEFGGCRMLLVDDDELNVMLGARLIEAIGFEVVTAANGQLAAEQAQRAASILF